MIVPEATTLHQTIREHLTAQRLAADDPSKANLLAVERTKQAMVAALAARPKARRQRVRGPDRYPRRGKGTKQKFYREVHAQDIRRIFAVIKRQTLPWDFTLQDMLDLLPTHCSEKFPWVDPNNNQDDAYYPWNAKRLASQFKMLKDPGHPRGFSEEGYTLLDPIQVTAGLRRGQRLWRIERRKGG